MASAAQYLEQLQALLPPGAAWARDSEATLTKLLAGLAEEFARVEGRGLVLVEEADPRTTAELLGEWETAFGLPDSCAVTPSTVPGRQLALHQRVASLDGQSVPYFVTLSALLGYEAEIDEFRPLRLPFTIPARVAGRRWAFAWRVNVFGPAEMGNETPVYADTHLDCVITRIAPGHTVVSFSYEPDPDPIFHFDFLNP